MRKKKNYPKNYYGELSEKINLINENDIIEITYYVNRQYKKIRGKVKKIDLKNKRIIIINNANIYIEFKDIFKLEKY